EKYIPPSKGRRHVLRIVRELLYFQPEGRGTDLGNALETLSHLLKRKAVVFLLSDFMDEGYETALRLSARRHDLIALHLYDSLECHLPDAGLLRLKDVETGEECWVDSSSDRLRSRFHSDAARRERDVSRLLSRNAVDEIRLDVQQEFVSPLVQFFRRRMKRLARGFRRTAPLALFILALLQSTSGAQTPAATPFSGNPGAAAEQGLPVFPRAALKTLEEKSIEELCGAARPRRELRRDMAASVESYLEKDLQTIGDPNLLRWTFVLEEGAEALAIDWPAPPAQILPLWNPETEGELADTLNIQDFLRIDSLFGQEQDTLRLNLAFSTFAPDTFSIAGPILRYQYEGKERELLSAALLLSCQSVLSTGPDSAALRDWKEAGRIRGNWLKPLLSWGLPALALLVFAIWLLLRLRRRERPLAELPRISPDEEAMASLRVLEEKDMPARQAFHAFHSQLSLILRRYLHRRYGLPFSDWTQEEILLGLKRISLDTAWQEDLSQLLENADLVKYAQGKSREEECRKALSSARGFVRASRFGEESS
ncbi:MAG: hypothetical protein QGG33_00140, partial [Candidatus Krumholzibacteria bacterium]|nr:hypothetical protein [Candidatus Krumholzibacteria bacterium]